jgi:hypothetical protein
VVLQTPTRWAVAAADKEEVMEQWVGDQAGISLQEAHLLRAVAHWEEWHQVDPVEVPLLVEALPRWLEGVHLKTGTPLLLLAEVRQHRLELLHLLILACAQPDQQICP